MPWGTARVLLEEVVKVGGILEAQAVGNVGNAPLGVAQQGPRFLTARWCAYSTSAGGGTCWRVCPGAGAARSGTGPNGAVVKSVLRHVGYGICIKNGLEQRLQLGKRGVGFAQKAGAHPDDAKLRGLRDVELVHVAGIEQK